jgi:hypothetical protein
MGACEDGGCRDIPPPQGVGPWVLFWKTEVNGNFPYWESVGNLASAMSAEIQTQLSGMLDAFRTELLAEVDSRISQAIAMSCGGMRGEKAGAEAGTEAGAEASAEPPPSPPQPPPDLC